MHNRQFNGEEDKMGRPRPQAAAEGCWVVPAGVGGQQTHAEVGTTSMPVGEGVGDERY